MSAHIEPPRPWRGITLHAEDCTTPDWSPHDCRCERRRIALSHTPCPHCTKGARVYYEQPGVSVVTSCRDCYGSGWTPERPRAARAHDGEVGE